MIKCFYHSEDLDGKCSAAIVKKFEPQAHMCPINYGDHFPWCSIEPGTIIYMVDFSLPIEEMIRLQEMVGEDSFIWIDHHKTAIQAAEKARFYPMGMRNDAMAACEIAWHYFSDYDPPCPLGVELLGRYDTWDHSNPLTLPFQYGMRASGEWHPEDKAWSLVFENDPTIFAETVKGGTWVLQYETIQNQIRAKALCFDAKIDGLFVIAANQGLAGSKLFDSVWRPEKYQAMVTFCFRDPKWHFSLYTTRDDVDVSEVAKKRGGGGHKGAAGFVYEGYPLDILSPVPF